MCIRDSNKHRYRIGSDANVKFSRNHFLEHHGHEVPIHVNSFLSNMDFFKKNGQIIYTINLSPSADQFPELFEYGMNHFFAHLDKKIRSVIRSGDVKLIISCLNEKCNAYEKHHILNNIKIQDPEISSWTELWTPWAVPNTTIDLTHVKDVPMYETLMCNEFQLQMYEQPLKTKRNKKFVSLCRRYQPERIATFMFLVAHNLIDQGYVSMPSKSVYAPFIDLYSETANGHLIDSDVRLMDCLLYTSDAADE